MKPNKTRAPDKTVLGVSMPKDLKERIHRLAELDRRNMAQWCVVQLEKAVEELESTVLAADPPQVIHPPLTSMEDPAEKQSAPESIQRAR